RAWRRVRVRAGHDLRDAHARRVARCAGRCRGRVGPDADRARAGRRPAGGRQRLPARDGARPRHAFHAGGEPGPVRRDRPGAPPGTRPGAGYGRGAPRARPLVGGDRGGQGSGRRLVSRGTAAMALALLAAGIEVAMVDRAGGRAQAVVDARQLRDLAALPSVLAIRPAERGRLRTGSVTSAGDAAARADLVRGLGYDGSGTVVGVISDGIDHAAVAQATGDLPAVMVPADARCRPGSGDEGTALLEIVHDLAPGAQLVFSEGLTSGLVFIDSVNCLVAAGAGVIADDLVFFDEPFFADGPLALAVRAAVQAGVSYHSAAGNEAEEHVEQPFRASPDSSFHDFLGGTVDNADDMLVLPAGTLACFLQWN